METQENLKMEIYQLKCDLIAAKEMYFEKSCELIEKNNELKQKNEKLEEYQKIIVELKEEISAVRKINENLTRNLHENQSESMLENDENKELKKIIEKQSKEMSSLKSESKKQIETLKNELCAKENVKRSGVKKSLVNESSVKKEITTENTSVLLMESSEKIYLLDSGANCWKKLRIYLPIKMHSFGAALVNGEIYIFGGHSGPTCYQNCYKLKSDGKWIELASLNEKRTEISNSSVVYFEEIWIIGGNSDDQFLKSVEKYNIPQNKWIQMPSLNLSRYEAAAAVYKNKIIVTGGVGGDNLAELFDPELQKWIIFCALPIDVQGHCITISGSILTIYGGYSDCPTKNVWEMDIEDPQKKWYKQKQDLKYERCYFGIAKLLNGIMAIGGYGNDGTTEIFNGNNWKEGPRLPQKIDEFAYTIIPRSVEEDLLNKFL